MQKIRFTRENLGLALLSGSVLGLQVTFTRIFSLIIWYHFTYLIVGIALLGGGAAGTYLAVRQWDKETLQARLGKIAILFGISILVNLLVISLVRFDPLNISKESLVTTLLGLLIYFASLFTSFFLGGLSIAGAFTVWNQAVNRLYFSDLIGASVGTLAVVLVIQLLGGPGALGLIALLVLVGALLFGRDWSPRWKRGVVAGLVLDGILVAVIAFISPLQLAVPESKELGWALKALNVRAPEYTSWNPVARVDVLPVTTFQPDIAWLISGGMSPAYTEGKRPFPETYPLQFVTLDGTSITAFHQFTGDLSRFDFLKDALASAPYQVVNEHPNVLSIGIGGGLDLLLAQVHQANHVTGIELNGDLIDLLKSRYADFTGHLLDNPKITAVHAEGRSFLSHADTRYDIIEGMGVDNFAALSGGSYVLSESYIYTTNAVKQALQSLTPAGVFAWTRQTNSPPRETLRLTGMAAQALREMGVTNPAAHIAVVENPTEGWATLLVSPSAFSESSIQKLRDWAASNEFTLLQDPLVKLDTPYSDYVHAADPQAFEASYPYNIFPVTDDNPFFYNYYRWSDFSLNRASSGDVNNSFPIGNLILLTMLGFSILTAVIFIIAPLVSYRRSQLQTRSALPMLAYFSLLGLAYIFIEIVLIQRFTLFIGYPTHAITTTIFSLLFFSAIGSLVSPRFLRTSGQLRLHLFVLAGVISLYIVGLPMLFQSLFQLDDSVRILLSIIIIAPLALLMGMPFPTGLRQLGVQAQNLVPWAWGMNGVFSVVGSVLVIIVSMMRDFTTAMLLAAVCYGLAGVLAAAMERTRVVAAAPVQAAPDMRVAPSSE